ncbi:PREDICTED: ER membrane protein complex subunit 6-like [Priapulus caudatus]|uniref:ER membrane protein complex subunit 6 n=1 Tax=Priapulus caudatus TaxID=37621 RepID=A0ABM1DTH4_PRICU|nr:PREDICTED: ER membrane protein complex subunit 6-like [Priapulus caudatus]
MAASASAKTKRFKNDNVVYNSVAIRNNAAVIDYCRTSLSALSGCTAGILGLTGLNGFIFYFVTALCLSVVLLMKGGNDWSRYFMSRTSLASNGLLGGLFTYVLFWTFLYGMVHVY